MEDKIQVNLNKEEAIVLFEFLSRFSSSDKLEINDPAETTVLWNVVANLERILVEPFSWEYSKILELAREKIRKN